MLTKNYLSLKVTKQHMKQLSLIVLLFTLTACSSLNQMSANQKKEGHYRLYTHPEKIKTNHTDKRYKRIVFFSSNDFRGEIQSKFYKVKNRFKEKRYLGIGGISAYKAYIEAAKKVFPNQVIHIDSGSFLVPTKNPSKTIFYYNYLGLSAAAMGSSEFTFDRKEKLFRHIKKANFPVIVSNIYDLQTNQSYKSKALKRSYIKTINGIKIGFISTFSNEHIGMIPKEKLQGLFLRSTAQTVISEANYLRRKGAKVIALLTNSSIDCSTQEAETQKISHFKVNFDSRSSKSCNTYKNPLAQALKLLPKKTLDIVFTSSAESKIANTLYGIPVLQSFPGGEHLSWAELYYDTKLKVVSDKKTKIYQPIHLCHHFLKSTQDCYIQEDFSFEEVVPAIFLGEKIKVNPLPLHR